MSLKNMITKLALAFAAKKGLDAFTAMGGMPGLAARLQNATPAGPDTESRTDEVQTADTEGLGSIIEALGQTRGNAGRSISARQQGNPLNASLGSLFGTLANAFNQSGSSEKSGQDLQHHFTIEDFQSEDEARPVLRAMVQMARADGSIDNDEQSFLFGLLEDASDSEQAALRRAFREPVDAASVARDTPDYARKEVYSAALLVGEPDHPHEKSFLTHLAQALRLRQGEVDDLHRAIGKAPIAV
ncbi:DUF533 domain-containing protein [Roseobacter weihaiensis]|uniref:DUF533 domain-containing protein n=1 Tax=Roseobacter weihaiensis TaxID=2763262 RepID=UPI001D09DC5A|nr:DUF533 domain-containing protein [Roseobacter sp. H9]